MRTFPEWELPLYRFSAGAADAVGARLKGFFKAQFTSILVLRHRESQNRDRDAPVIVKTDQGQIEVSLVDITGGGSERLGIAFDSIKMDGKDGKGRDLAELGWGWTPLELEELGLVSGHFISAIRLIGSELRGIEFDVSSKRVRGRIQIWSCSENCDDSFGLSVTFVQPFLEWERRRIICESMNWFPERERP